MATPELQAYFSSVWYLVRRYLWLLTSSVVISTPGYSEYLELTLPIARASL